MFHLLYIPHSFWVAHGNEGPFYGCQWTTRANGARMKGQTTKKRRKPRTMLSVSSLNKDLFILDDHRLWMYLLGYWTKINGIDHGSALPLLNSIFQDNNWRSRFLWINVFGQVWIGLIIYGKWDNLPVDLFGAHLVDQESLLLMENLDWAQFSVFTSDTLIA